MPLKVLIADDEKEARELLIYYLDNCRQEMQLAECADGKCTLKALQDFKPDILFLDIKMPELTGIEVLQHKKPGPLPAVIFTTAYDEFALPAFDLEAVDYLLKPFEKERFEKALKRAMDYVQFAGGPGGNYLTQLPGKTGSRTDLIPINDIQYFQAEGSYVQVVTDTKTYLIPQPIYELESGLDPSRFARVHRSVIVNIGCIKSIQSLLNGDHMLTLANGKKIRASRTYKEKIKNWKN
ncbi:MAG TPA: LytTR family DNA-binding domain-containing protein [Chitinophagaceae bacterium]|nr:LytTR family DNA-binding domain-containing protein [Chitinophagaceae bacterium]